MNDSGEEFRVRPGRIRSTHVGKPKSFVNQVLRAAKKAGHTAVQPGVTRHSIGIGRSTFGRGRMAPTPSHSGICIALFRSCGLCAVSGGKTQNPMA
jgi:hypothetical protein